MKTFCFNRTENTKFTLLIEKVTFQEKQYKIWFLSTKFGFNGSLLKIKQYAWGEKYLFSSHLKKTRRPKAGYFFLLWILLFAMAADVSSYKYKQRKLLRIQQYFHICYGQILVVLKTSRYYHKQKNQQQKKTRTAASSILKLGNARAGNFITIV